MPEFVLVSYKKGTLPISRKAFVDSRRSGETNEVIRVQQGTHTFDLGDPENYDPVSIKRMVRNTTRIRPLVLKFTPLEYLRVTYPGDRQVLVDGTPAGGANTSIRVTTGRHKISLAGPADYNPPFITTSVEDTSRRSPLELAFSQG